jgi:hypothetical protein
MQTQSSHYLIQSSNPVILLGMHRSGTSLTTRLLKDVGIFMGSKLSKNAESPYFQNVNREIFARAKATWSKIDPVVVSMNAKDYIEREAQWLHNALFDKSGIKAHFDVPSWNEISQSHAFRWGWKDPRTTITFPIWLRIFPDAKFVHVIRNGIDVAISLNRRHMTRSKWWHRFSFYHDYNPEIADFQYCFKLWESYVTYINKRRYLIPECNYLELRYEDLLTAPDIQFANLLGFLEHLIDANLFEQVCQQINVQRLNNKEYRAHYRSEIDKLTGSALMRQYHYQ